MILNMVNMNGQIPQSSASNWWLRNPNTGNTNNENNVNDSGASNNNNANNTNGFSPDLNCRIQRQILKGNSHRGRKAKYAK